MSAPIALGRLPLPTVALATLLAVAVSLVLVALGDGGVPSRMAPSPAPVADTAPPPAPVFEPNQGQADAAVDFISRGSGYTLFLSGTDAVLSLEAGRPGSTTFLGDGTLTRGTGMEPEGAAVRMGLAGANADPAIAGRAQRAGTASYLRGDDPSKWRKNIPTFGRVHYSAVYPGIDMAWYGNSAGLEYDFELAPGADANRIGLTFEGAESVRVDGRDLVVQTAVGELRHQPPFAYQENAGTRERVEARYAVRPDGAVGFELGAYDRTRPLVIDPQLVYSTYLGGTGSDRGSDVAVDASGHAYIVGSTDSPNYPTTAGAFRTADTDPGERDVFVSKLSADGSSLVYSTYLGGTGQDEGGSIEVDASGHAYVTGRAVFGFPTTPGSFQPTDPDRSADVFLAKLSPDGSSLVYSTYLGSRGIFDDFADVAVDADGSAYLAGQTDGDNHPTTPGTFQPTDPEPGAPASGFDGYVTKFKPDGSGLEWSTYLGAKPGGDGPLAIAVEGEAPYVIGTSSSDAFPTTSGAYRTTAPSTGSESDGYVAKLAEDGSRLEYATYLGGSRSDTPHGLGVRGGTAYVGGFTQSTNFPTTPGSFQQNPPSTASSSRGDGFVTALAPDGGSLEWSTYLGGTPETDQEGILALDVGADGRPSVTGRTASTAFPTTRGAQQETDPDPTAEDAFVTTLSADGSDLDYSTYLGGHNGAAEFGSGIALDSEGDIYVGGLTHSRDFPTTPGAFQESDPDAQDYEAFVTKLHPERDAARVPTALVLDPDTAVNTVGTQHCVTATVTDQDGAALEGTAVWFTVSGASDTGGGSQTDAEGRAQFCYDGPAFPGEDAISAYADADGDAAQDEGEPSDSASKQWVLAAGTEGCKVTGGGSLVTASGDRATFGGVVRSFTDHGPATPLSVRSTGVLVVVCSEDRTSATIYGTASVDGSGEHLYRVQVTDGGEPSSSDSYEILLASGYSSGTQPLRDGNVQIR